MAATIISYINSGIIRNVAGKFPSTKLPQLFSSPLLLLLADRIWEEIDRRGNSVDWPHTSVFMNLACLYLELKNHKMTQPFKAQR
jgi:hypothetical protein